MMLDSYSRCKPTSPERTTIAHLEYHQLPNAAIVQKYQWLSPRVSWCSSDVPIGGLQWRGWLTFVPSPPLKIPQFRKLNQSRSQQPMQETVDSFE